MYAQSVSGTVSSEDGPLPGATVVVKGTNNGTTTDFDGNFTIAADADRSSRSLMEGLLLQNN